VKNLIWSVETSVKNLIWSVETSVDFRWILKDPGFSPTAAPKTFPLILIDL
jgi:hypothetical protein